VATFGYRVVQRFESGGTLGLMALAFAFILAWSADLAGSALIIGAFAAGLVLDDRHDRRQIENATGALGYFFVPIFFASVGASVDLKALADPRALAVGGMLSVVGIVGKVAAGYAAFWFKGNKLLVGAAMVPRGEVGLIFAQMGLAWGALDKGEFGAVMMMVIVTTLVTPPVLAVLARRMSDTEAGIRGPGPGEMGIDELVVGTWPGDQSNPGKRETKAIRPPQEPPE
jgi:Kef-type K+ transport system membrane component KefB